jgi:hypothetical protein
MIVMKLRSDAELFEQLHVPQQPPARDRRFNPTTCFWPSLSRHPESCLFGQLNQDLPIL